MDDLISRKAAIKLLEKWEENHIWDEWCNEHKVDKERLQITPPSDCIRSLPSAETPDVEIAYYKGMKDGIKKCTERLKKFNDENK